MTTVYSNSSKITPAQLWHSSSYNNIIRVHCCERENLCSIKKSGATSEVQGTSSQTGGDHVASIEGKRSRHLSGIKFAVSHRRPAFSDVQGKQRCMTSIAITSLLSLPTVKISPT